MNKHTNTYYPTTFRREKNHKNKNSK